MTEEQCRHLKLDGKSDPGFMDTQEKIDAMRERLGKAAEEDLEQFDRDAAAALLYAQNAIVR